MKDVECYNQNLIDMKEQYQKDVKTFMKVTLWNSNNMQLASILDAYQVMMIKKELVRIQMEYHENGKFQSHGLTSWPRYPKCFSIVYQRCMKLEMWIEQHIPSLTRNMSLLC